MDTSYLIARLLGPVMVVAGIAIFVNRKQMAEVFEDFVASPALIFIAGVLALVMGIAIVNAHNLWVADWRIILTLVGWIAILGGIVRMVFPGAAIGLGRRMMRHETVLAASGAVNLMLGAFLAMVGFSA